MYLFIPEQVGHIINHGDVCIAALKGGHSYVPIQRTTERHNCSSTGLLHFLFAWSMLISCCCALSAFNLDPARVLCVVSMALLKSLMQ